MQALELTRLREVHGLGDWRLLVLQHEAGAQVKHFDMRTTATTRRHARPSRNNELIDAAQRAM